MSPTYCTCIAKTFYQNSNRAYHNIDHIDNMLKVAGTIYYSLYKIPMTLELQYAIYYHDVIYDATRTDNEDASAKFYLGAKCNNVNDDLVVGLINLTSMHMLSLNDNQIFNIVGNNVDVGKIMLDADLAGFADDANYITNSNIRLEYKHCDDYEYSHGRIKFLHTMLNKPNIFYTDYAKEYFEDKARNNIIKEIDNLRQQCTLC